MYFCILCRNLRWPPKMEGKWVLWKATSRLSRKPAGQKFCQNHSISNGLPDKCVLRITQKFKMATKNGGKVIFAKCRQYTLQITCGSKILSKSLYLTPFPRWMRFCDLRRNSRWLPKVAGKRFLQKSRQ